MKKTNLNIEDAILYVFGFLLMTFLAFYFYQVHKETSKVVTSDLERNMTTKLEIKDIEGSRSADIQFLRGQLQLVYKRYDLASKMSTRNAYIKYISFVIGSLLCLLGTMVVIRGVRESTIDLDIEAFNKAKLKFLTSSPGIFIVLAGTAIIITTLISGNELSGVKDDGITYYNSSIMKQSSDSNKNPNSKKLTAKDKEGNTYEIEILDEPTDSLVINKD